ncbi:hypothetical protein QQ045_004380 [Rhodiola kirilowii]
MQDGNLEEEFLQNKKKMQRNGNSKVRNSAANHKNSENSVANHLVRPNQFLDQLQQSTSHINN